MSRTAIVRRNEDADQGALTAVQVSGRIQRIQQVMKKVMKKDVHFGVVPGTPKPSLWKPGAEVLCTTFRIAPSYVLDNQSDDDHYEYVVRCIGTHQETGKVLGEGMGAASSNEEKYKWRAAVCPEEFEEADEDRKRVKWRKGYQGAPPEQIAQLRAEPADINNTVLKMACKRAQIAMVINVTGASDIFAQDLEDLPDGGNDQRGGRGARGGGKPNTTAPKATTAQTGDGPRKVTESQGKLLHARLQSSKVDARQFCEHFAIASVIDLPFESMNGALDWINANAS